MSDSKIERARDFLLSDSKLEIINWEENDEGNWFNHIYNKMFKDETKEFKDIILYTKKAIDELYIKYFSTVPTYTEHYMTHSRNVINIALKFLEFIPNEIDEEDVLLIALAGLLHDLGQYDPVLSYQPRNDPEKTEEALKDIFNDIDRIISNGNYPEKYKILFNKDSVFRKKVFLFALYHQKNMPFDEDYITKYYDIKKVELKNITLSCRLDCEKIFAKYESSEALKNHYLGLAALFQLADGLDIQKFRETTLYSISTRIASVIKESKRYLLNNNDSDFKKNDSDFKKSITQISHLIKDLLIDRIEIKETDKGTKRIIMNLYKDQSKQEAKNMLENIKNSIIPNVYHEHKKCSDVIYKIIINYLLNQNDDLIKSLKSILNNSNCNSLNVSDVDENNFFNSLIENYIKNPLNEELLLTKNYIEEYLGLKIEKIDMV